MPETLSLPSIPAIAAALRHVLPDEADAVADLENLVGRATTGEAATVQVQPGEAEQGDLTESVELLAVAARLAIALWSIHKNEKKRLTDLSKEDCSRAVMSFPEQYRATLLDLSVELCAALTTHVAG